MARVCCDDCGFYAGLHSIDCAKRPTPLVPVLQASIRAAERGELPVQKRKAAEREARIEALRGHLLTHALRLAERLANGQHSCLVPESGTGKAMVEIHDELKALGAEEK